MYILIIFIFYTNIKYHLKFFLNKIDEHINFHLKLNPRKQNIDRLIDSKTRFIDALDRTNIEKNRQANIVVPAPIPDFQSLISAIIQPKIRAITGKIGSLSGAFLGGSGAGGDNGAGAGGNGLSNILGSVLRLSGPILGSSAGGGAGASAGAGAGADTSLDPIDSSETTEATDSKEA